MALPFRQVTRNYGLSRMTGCDGDGILNVNDFVHLLKRTHRYTSWRSVSELFGR